MDNFLDKPLVTDSAQLRRARKNKEKEKEKEINLEKEKLRIAIYTRVSTDVQAEKFSLSAQEKICRSYISDQNWNVESVFVYNDPGFSGKNDKRPNFLQMMRDAENHMFNLIVIHKIDRFMRNLILCYQYIKRYKELGVGIIFCGDHFNFIGSMESDVLFLLFAWMAENYSTNLSEETKKGKKESILKGYSNGAAPFGYIKKDGELHAVEKITPYIQEIFTRYASGLHSFQQLANYLNDEGLRTTKGNYFSGDSIKDIITNCVYAGNVIYEDKAYPGRHDGIISVELFNQCDVMRRKRSNGRVKDNQPKGNIRERYMLTGIISCKYCGNAMISQTKHKAQPKYYENPKKAANCPYKHPKGSISWSVPSSVVDKQVEDIIAKIRLPKDWIKHLEDATHKEDPKKAISDKIDRLKNKIEREKDYYLQYGDSEDGPNFFDRRRNLDAELAELIRKWKEMPDSLQAQTIHLDKLQAVFSYATLPEKSDMARMLFQKILYDHDKGKVVSFIPSKDFVGLFNGIADENNWTTDAEGVYHL